MSGNIIPVPKWAYIGTDNSGVPTYPFSSGNSLPALVVWLMLTTNLETSGLLTASPTTPAQTAAQASALQQISDSVNLTTACVKVIVSRFQAATPSHTPSEVSNAFTTVIDSLHLIGDPQNYPPRECPYMTDVLKLSAALSDFVPQPRPALH